ncbi:MAG: citrate synthase [Gammaproteobacteria bacterium]|nr:citrate synthase [Gammaproteobacteria bacterium]
MADTATLHYDGKTIELPIVTGTEGERGVDIRELRAKTGLITLDSGYGNTGSTESSIAFIDGEKGILRYRGYPIEQLAAKSRFTETAYLLIFGELPTPAQYTAFRALLTEHQFMHEALHFHFDGFPENAPPMAILSAMVSAAGCFDPALAHPEVDGHFMEASARMMSKVRTIAAASYCKSIGRPINYPRFDLPYTANFLHMMFSLPHKQYEPSPVVVDALDKLLILHADHEQNCSTSTVRMVCSSRASLSAAVSSGINALWGPLHGGANSAVIEMLTHLHQSGESIPSFINRVKTDRTTRLMGFGHRVYRNFDPRAKIIKEACDNVLKALGIHDPLLDLAMQLEEVALHDEFFVSRKLYPNVDFYSGIIMRAIGIPTDMFTVMFALGRMPGWLAHWREYRTSTDARIDRPRQIYQGYTQRDYVAIEKRKESRD